MSKLHLGFSEPATQLMEGIIDLHNHIMIYLIFILVLVLWFFFAIIYQFWFVINHPTENHIVKTNRGDMRRFRPFSHHSLLEVFWTITPSLVLISIAIPSFEMLYYFEPEFELNNTFKVIGHQWYWSYENYEISADDVVKFDGNLLFEEDLPFGHKRLLRTDVCVPFPVDVPCNVVITSMDVLHSWSVPSLGVKCDAVPGRLNHVVVLAKREGVFLWPMF